MLPGMRRSVFQATTADARALFAAAPYVYVGGCTADGTPVVRAVHGVVVDDGLYFHAAPGGEKFGLRGQPVQVTTSEVVAEIPSYAMDPQRACPATTYYRSASVHAVLEDVDEPEHKARVLQLLMERFQPEGGHAPLDAEDPRYTAALKGLWVGRVALVDAVAKFKLGQNRKPEQLAAIVETLWRRGEPGDPEAIEAIRAARPSMPCPAFLRPPEGLSIHCVGGEDDAAQVAGLLSRTHDAEACIAAHLGSSAWVVAKHDGRVVGSARAIGDGACEASIVDVVVDVAHRRRGVGSALVRLLLDHPRVRRVRTVHLRDEGPAAFHRQLGFEAMDAPRWLLRRAH